MSHRTIRNRDIVNPTSDILRDAGWLLIAVAIMLAAASVVAGTHIAVIMIVYLVLGVSAVKLVKASKRY